MPRGGQNRKSKAEKMLSNTYNATRDSEGELPGVGNEIISIPSPPANLTDLGTNLWITYTNALIISRKLYDVHLPTIQVLVDLTEDYWEYKEYVSSLDSISQLDDKTFHRRELVNRAKRQTQDSIRKILNDFGFSLASLRVLDVKPSEAGFDFAIELMD